MPLYVYETNEGHSIEQFYHNADDAPESISLEVEGRKLRARRTLAPAKKVLRAGWPMKSTSIGVNPDQIDEAIRDFAEKGIDIDYDREDGRAILKDAQHRKAVAKAMGLVDRDGY